MNIVVEVLLLFLAEDQATFNKLKDEGQVHRVSVESLPMQLSASHIRLFLPFLTCHA